MTSTFKSSWLPFIFLSLVDAALASLPLVDFDRMGRVGLAGAFAGLDLFNDSTGAVSFDPSTATLLSRSPNGDLTRLGSTSSGGSILAGCALDGTFYFAGSFSSIEGTSVSNVATYHSGVFSSLGSDGPNGEIHALFCDAKNNKVWTGGKFTLPGASVAVWDVKASSWSAAPFGGLSGALAEVLSITTNSSQSSLFFAGSFTTFFQGNESALNTTNNPNVPFSIGATPFSSSLVPIPLQNAEIEGEPSSSDRLFSTIQNILCPGGVDGPGNTWLGADGNRAQITVRTFQSISASGIRLGNTFVNGRGTTAFTVTSIPDNAVQQLHYVDHTTGQNQTCTNNCPLSTDPGVPYQDFTFDTPRSLTGVQVTLSQWQGAGPGLHLFQLLSSGAFASAVDSQNEQSCFAPVASNSSRIGTWTEEDANTDIAATMQSILVTSVPVGTPAAQSPSFTWRPYVSASGTYTINLLVPGCSDFQDCPSRTSIKVTVFPGGGQPPTVTTVSQRNQNDAAQHIYTGPVITSSPDFVTTITMTLADNPAGIGQNGNYHLVADRVQLVLNSAYTTGGATNSYGGGAGQHGFGFFEWPLSSSGNVNATSILANPTETALDTIGINMLAGLGGLTALTSSTSAISAVAHHPSGIIFLGGDFKLSTPGTSNLVMFKNGALSALSGGGLNGPVTSLALDGDDLFVGGSFSDTMSGSTQNALSGVASYSITQDRWSGMQGGVDGGVASLSFANGELQLAGNFTHAGAGLESAGMAVWDAANSTWANAGGFIVGSMTLVANDTASAGGQFVAGNVAASLRFGASGFVMLQNAQHGVDVPAVTPLGAILEDGDAAAAPAKMRRRSVGAAHVRRGATAWMSHLKLPLLFARQAPASSTLAPLPAAPPGPAPAVLAGVFWTNTSTSHEVAIIGGNFSFPGGAHVALYDTASGSISPLQGAQVNGTVRALFVDGDQLFVGGEFTMAGTNINGFAIYDLTRQTWDVSSLQPLQPASAASVVVRSITTSSSREKSIIVAGSFAQAGSLTCRAVCSFDTSAKQWRPLGQGIQGDISSINYAGNNQETLIAAGSISLSGSSPNNVVSFTFGNGSWTAVGDSTQLPGPVTAMEVNNQNSSSIFAAGRSSDGASPFLSFWNGASWTSLSSGLQGPTNVSQLTMVPLQDTHSVNGIIEPDRMLLVSGYIADSAFGNASSALFDGQSFIPYFMTASASGTPGTVAALFHSFTSFSFTQHHFLATGIIILISIAISAGVVFLLVLIGILWTLFSRRDDALNKLDPGEVEDDASSTHQRPSSLLAHINAATRTTILGSQNPFNSFHPEKEEEAGVTGGSDPFAGPDASNYLRAETPSDAIAGMQGDDEGGRPAHARYSFDGTEEGELPLTVGLEVEILDDRDHSWWYARDVRSGHEGVVPSAYLY